VREQKLNQQKPVEFLVVLYVQFANRYNQNRTRD